VEPGPLHARIVFGAPLPEPTTGRPFAIPDRKRCFRTIDVGIPESEGDWNGAGFGEPVLGPVLLGDVRGSWREATRGRARFELDLPSGEPVWMRLRTFGFSPVSGRMLMDGEELGRFARMEAPVFEIPAASPGSEESRRHTFDLVFDPLPPDAPPMRLQRIELYRGPGVIEY